MNIADGRPLNCKALNQRRINLKAAITTWSKRWISASQQISVCDFSDTGADRERPRRISLYNSHTSVQRVSYLAQSTDQYGSETIWWGRMEVGQAPERALTRSDRIERTNGPGVVSGTIRNKLAPEVCNGFQSHLCSMQASCWNTSVWLSVQLLNGSLTTTEHYWALHDCITNFFLWTWSTLLVLLNESITFKKCACSLSQIIIVKFTHLIHKPHFVNKPLLLIR